jgi:hypothetical protein
LDVGFLTLATGCFKGQDHPIIGVVFFLLTFNLGLLPQAVNKACDNNQQVYAIEQVIRFEIFVGL